MLKSRLASLVLLLAFTGADVVWAETAHQDILPEDPEPKARIGPALRIGTAVGYSTFGSERVDTLGGTVSVAWQLGRVAVEADYGYFKLHEPLTTDERSGTVELGRFHRAGVSGKLDVLRLGRGVVGDNTKLIFWAEAGVGMQRGYFLTGETFRRNDAMVGFGWLLDHRLERPLGFPSRIGWHFGWRLLETGDAKVSTVEKIACKSPVCNESSGPLQIGLLVSSGMHFSW